MFDTQPKLPNDGANLDAIFSALSDPTRRAILARLKSGEASVKELAEPFSMSQPAISKHLKVLEKAELIERNIDRQRRPARLRAERLEQALKWLEDFKSFWLLNLDALDNVLAEMSSDSTKEKANNLENLKWGDDL